MQKDKITEKWSNLFIDNVGVKVKSQSLFLDENGKPIQIKPGVS